MLNQDKDRVSDETLVYSTPSGSHEPAGPRAGVLFVRLWSAAGKRLDCRPTRNAPPLLNLVLDTIRSSGGTPGTEGAEFLSARFPDVYAGLQCARRIQWAVEGLMEYESFRGAGAAVLMDIGDPSRRQQAPSVQDWEAVEPGRILLRPVVSEVLEGVPGVALGGMTAAGWREWSWRALQADASFAADEQAVGGMIQAAGRSDPGAVLPPMAGARTTGSTALGESNWSNGPETLPDTGDAFEREARRPSLLRMPIVAGAVGVVLVAVLVIFFLSHKTPVQSATPGQTPASAPDTRPAPSAPPVAAPPPATVAVERPNPTGPSGKHARDKKAAVVEPKVAPTPVAVHCDLTEEDIQRSLARADRYTHDGDLADARAAYQHVVGCPSARERAQEGLIRIQRMAAQNGSPN